MNTTRNDWKVGLVMAAIAPFYTPAERIANVIQAAGVLNDSMSTVTAGVVLQTGLFIHHVRKDGFVATMKRRGKGELVLIAGALAGRVYTEVKKKRAKNPSLLFVKKGDVVEMSNNEVHVVTASKTVLEDLAMGTDVLIKITTAKWERLFKTDGTPVEDNGSSITKVTKQ